MKGNNILIGYTNVSNDCSYNIYDENISCDIEQLVIYHE